MTTTAQQAGLQEANRAIRHAGQIAAIATRPAAVRLAPTPPRWQRALLAAIALACAAALAFIRVNDDLGTLLIALALAGGGALCGLYALSAVDTPWPPSRRSLRARLLADCDAQHAAWRRGDDFVATYGRFPPAKL
jgi:hypothetical protein